MPNGAYFLYLPTFIDKGEDVNDKPCFFDAKREYMTKMLSTTRKGRNFIPLASSAGSWTTMRRPGAWPSIGESSRLSLRAAAQGTVWRIQQSTHKFLQLNIKQQQCVYIKA